MGQYLKAVMLDFEEFKKMASRFHDQLPIFIQNEKKEWWEDLEYKYWNQPNSEWIENLEDLPNLKEIIEKKDLILIQPLQGWRYLSSYLMLRDSPGAINI